ncbi:MAG: multicopper oxidase family protein [Nitrospirota bacterium]
MNKLSRREFLAMSAVGAASGLLYGKTGFAQMGGGGGATIINPLPNGVFKDPPVMPLLRNGNVVSGALVEAGAAQVNIAGTNADLLAYNGIFPAPTIRVKTGDILKLTFKNALPDLGTNIIGHDMSMTNLHTHGWHVSPAGNADNILLHFAPGEEFLFEYDLSKQPGGLLGFYHPHAHGTVAEQVWRGMSGGALVVEDETPALAGYETHLLLIKDISLAGSDPAPYTLDDYRMGKTGTIVMVNGQVNPVLPIRPGQVTRLRIVNSCNARYLRLALEGHTLHLVGCDGGLLDKPYPITEILLTPGERIDVLVKADQTSRTYRLLSLPYGNINQQVTLLTLSYGGTPVADSLPQSIPSSVADKVKFLRTLNRAAFRRVNLALQFVMGMGGVIQGAINGGVFGVNTFVLTSRIGTYEVWVVKNDTMMDHPFHQHVNGSVVLGITGGDPNYAALYSTIPALKDTVNVPPMGTLTMLVPVENYTGDTVFHCHILEHEDIGMMGLWRLV